MKPQLSDIQLTVNIVTWNNARTISAALKSLLAQEHFAIGENLFVNVLDNASEDETCQIIEKEFRQTVNLIRSGQNLGFSAAHNKLIENSIENSDYLVVMNPDLALEPKALLKLIEAFAADTKIGTACPKLLRANEELRPLSPAIIDAAGMFITPNCRHFDRGSEEPDQGQFEDEAYVFGGSGALLALSRNFVRDINISKDPSRLEVFDNDFFAYREDADLAWRAQAKGWRCRYTPKAVGYHVRHVTSERRGQLSSSINRYGVRNRFLLQIHNFSFRELTHCIAPTLWRNLVVLGATTTVEPTSLPALADIAKGFKKSLDKRRALFSCKRHPLAKWFKAHPYAEKIMTSKKPIESVHAIIVNYNSGFALESTLETLSKTAIELQGKINCKITVFDNASADASAARLDATYRNITQVDIVISSENLGFSGAINKVASTSSADALLVLNPDVNVSSECLLALVNSLNKQPEFAIAAPVLTNEDKSPQYGFLARRLPSLASSVCELLGLHKLLPRNKWTQRYLMLDSGELKERIESQAKDSSLFEVEQPAGACLLIRKETFDSLSGFDERLHPAWFEDVDFCKRSLDAGWKIGIETSSRAEHLGGSSLHHIGDKGFIRAFFPNYHRYWMKHGGTLDKIVFSACFRCGMLIRALSGIPAKFLGKESSAKHFFAVGLSPENSGDCVNQLRNLSALTQGPRAASKHLLKALTSSPKSTNSAIAIPRQGTNPPAALALEQKKLSDLTLEGAGLCLALEAADLKNDNRSDLSSIEASSVLSLSQAELEKLSRVEASSLDYLIAPRILERLPNPLRALESWCEKIKPGGTIYLTVDDKTQTDDVTRAHSTLEHLILDYLEPNTERTFEHYLERSTLVENNSGNDAIRFAKTLEKENAAIVLHPMTEVELRDTVDWFSKNITPIVRLEGPTRDPESSEIHLTLRVGGTLQ